MLKKRNLLFLSLLILGVLLLSSCFLKPPITEGILKGQVIVPEQKVQAKDLTGQALPDATVNIIDLASGEIIATTTTDTNGYYQVFVPPGGPYLLEAAKDGVKLEQITCPVEAGIEYDLGTADCTTTAVALIVQSMLDAGADLADINLADIEAGPNFDEVLSNVTSIIESGQDPTISSAVNQAVEDFLYPPEPTPTPAPTPTYSVTYNGNGNTGGTVPVDLSSPYANGASVTVLGNTGTLTKTQDGISLLFTGWNTASDGSGTGYDAGATFSIGNSDVTLYTQWTAMRATGPAGGLVFYDKGSVSDGWRYLEAASVDQSIGKWGTLNFAVPGADGTDIGTGKQNTLDIITGDSLSDKAADKCASYSVAVGAITYNDWFLPSKDEIYLMYTNLHVEGVGNFSGTATDYQYYSSSEYDPYKTWFQSFYNGNQQDGSKFAYDFRSRPARAFRSIAPTYLVNYHANGATGGSVPADPYHYEPGESVSVSNNTGSLVRTNYAFDGWNTEPDGSGTDRAEGSNFSIGSENVILYAKWIPTYTVTFDSQGGSAVNSQTVEEGGKVSEPTAPTKTGYTFGGWYKESACTNVWDFDTDMVTANVTLYAKWTINTYTVTYDGNGSTGGTVPVDPSSPYDYGTTVTVLGNTGTLSKTDYTFAGWNTQADANGTDRAVGSTFILGAANETLYAKWTSQTTYSLRDVGPAGGLIFYINPNYVTDGWRYLEAAPSDQIDNTQWGCDGTLISGADGTAVGTGKQNTIDIENGCATVGTAADICANLSLGGYNDWFLPSKDELNLMYTNLRLELVGNFNYTIYWSSSEDSASKAWYLHFMDGIPFNYDKDYGYGNVRAARAF